MFCDNCGKEIAAEVKFCRHCGYKLGLENSQIAADVQTIAVNDQKDLVSNDLNAPSIAAIEAKHEPEITSKQEENNTPIGFGCLSFIAVIIAGAFGKTIAKSLIRGPIDPYISHLGGGLVFGALCGLIPLYFAKKRAKSFERPQLISWGSVLICVIAGFIGGVTFALPTGIVVSSCIWYVSWRKNN